MPAESFESLAMVGIFRIEMKKLTLFEIDLYFSSRYSIFSTSELPVQTLV